MSEINLRELIIQKTINSGQLILNPSQKQSSGIFLSLPFDNTQIMLAYTSINFYYYADGSLAEITPAFTLNLNEISNITKTYNENYDIYGNAQLLITLNNDTEILLCYTVPKEQNIITTDEFVETLRNAKCGIMVASGGCEDTEDYSNYDSAVEWNSLYFDTAKIMCSADQLLCLCNENDPEIIKDGKNFSDIYARGSCYISLDNISKILELNDEQKCDLFNLSTGRTFEITVCDDLLGTPQKMCIGLLN